MYLYKVTIVKWPITIVTLYISITIYYIGMKNYGKLLLSQLDQGIVRGCEGDF